MAHIAHITFSENDNEKSNPIIETVDEHCKKVADLAAVYGKEIGLENTCYIAGLLHDSGKRCDDFDGYIRKENKIRRGEIDHSYAGAKYIIDFVMQIGDKKLVTVAKLIARIIMAHHGLCDWYTEDGTDYFEERRSKDDRYDEIKEDIKRFLPDDKLSELLEKAAEEYAAVYDRIKTMSDGDGVMCSFYCGMLERFCESCLVDADRTATAEFMNGIHISEQTDESLKATWSDMKVRIDSKLELFSKKSDRINLLRRDISDRCAAFANHKSHTIRLVVPTGGGKTLSSLRYAIEYCLNYDMNKIYYISPFKSILEQNGDVFGEIAGDDNYLEHHSDIYCQLSDNKDELAVYELHCQHWDKPVIATTMVQFFNTLFSSRSEALRRMHRLCRSVIILDEVQSVPVNCVYLFNLAVNFLAYIMDCTIVLCSATQPTFADCKYPLIVDSEDSMTGDYTKDFENFKRTEIVPVLRNGGYGYDEAAAICMEKYNENGNLLVIVNTKSAAAELFKRISELNDSSDNPATVLHLSTNMCAAHRHSSIDNIRKLLKENKRVICVTTQLIEAGVDISFRCVIRSLAGLDNAAQAAGRCNRNGDDECKNVYIIELKDENVSRLGEMSEAQTQSRNTILCKRFDDFLSSEAISYYFEHFYRECTNKDSKDLLAYCVEDKIHPDDSLLDFLSLNRVRRSSEKFARDKQAFATAGRLFRIIDDCSVSIIVPYNDEAKDIITRLNGIISFDEALDLQRKAQKYTVGVFNHIFNALAKNNAIIEIKPYKNKSGENNNEVVYVLKDEYYDKNTGITLDGAEQEALFC
ncbi:MAG: CRISPR-associated helicase Cas3' [Ruminiclostridium sp.]